MSKEAAKEKSIRHGHISTLHIWWARRPLLAARAALLGSLIADPGDKRGRDQLEDLIVRACVWGPIDDSSLLQDLRTRVALGNGGRAPRVLDCFAGGGAIPYEALRLGCEAYAIDLNPVANVIELGTLVYPQRYGTPSEDARGRTGLDSGRVVTNRLARDVEKWGHWVQEEARKELAGFYPQTVDGRQPIAYLWARTVRCPNPKCGAEVPLIRQVLAFEHPSQEGRDPSLARSESKASNLRGGSREGDHV